MAAVVAAPPLPQPGQCYLVRYNVGGPPVYHERLCLADGPAGGNDVIVFTPDGDAYAESARVSHDIAEVHHIHGLSSPAFGVPEGQTYRFWALPAAHVLLQHQADACTAAGLGVPAGGLDVVLGPYNPVNGVAGVLPLRAAAVPAAVPPVPAVGAVGGLPGGVAALAAAVGGPGAAAAAPVVPAAPGVGVGLGAPAGGPPIGGAGGAPGGVGLVAAALAGAGAAAVGAAAPAAAVDARTLPVLYDMRGLRFRSFNSAMEQVSQDPWPDWPVKGPRTVLWCLQFMAANGGSPTAWHSKWQAEQKLDAAHPNVISHDTCARALESMCCYDQVNPANLAAAELIARHLQLCEEREKDRKQKEQKGKTDDLTLDSHLFLGGGSSNSRLCICPELNEFISKELQAEAAVMKERRKAREERGLKKPEKS